MLQVDDYRDYYNQYFKEYNRLAVGEFADLSFGDDQPKDTCSSLESCIAYSNYIINNSVTPNFEILNAGAGASSWMFRKLFRNQVTCADPSKKYLELVRLTCKENLGDFNHGLMFEVKYGTPHGLFDHVYYDYGMIERIPYLGMAIDLANKSVYVDDVDSREECKPYREITIGLCKSLGLKWFDCMEAKDEHGRHGIIIEK